MAGRTVRPRGRDCTKGITIDWTIKRGRWISDVFVDGADGKGGGERAFIPILENEMKDPDVTHVVATVLSSKEQPVCPDRPR